jgi:hypothetical protein
MAISKEDLDKMDAKIKALMGNIDNLRSKVSKDKDSFKKRSSAEKNAPALKKKKK